MERIVERPGALDVHKAQVTACLRVWKGRELEERMAEFQDDGSWPVGAAGLAGGARGQAGRDGGDRRYWKPVWQCLRIDFELMLVNARAREAGGVGLALRFLSDVVLEQSSLVGCDLDS